jgi:hypothetical protein
VRNGFRFWDVGRSDKLIDDRLATLDEMEEALIELEKAYAEGAPGATRLFFNVVQNAEALRDRIQKGREFFKDLRVTLHREVEMRSES